MRSLPFSFQKPNLRNLLPERVRRDGRLRVAPSVEGIDAVTGGTRFQPLPVSRSHCVPPYPMWRLQPDARYALEGRSESKEAY